MKKIVLIAAAAASMGLAACSGNDNAADEANTAETNLEATTDEAVTDVNAATTDALNAADSALDNAGEAVENSAQAVGNAADAAADDAEAEVNGL